MHMFKDFSQNCILKVYLRMLIQNENNGNYYLAFSLSPMLQVEGITVKEADLKKLKGEK